MVELLGAWTPRKRLIVVLVLANELPGLMVVACVLAGWLKH